MMLSKNYNYYNELQSAIKILKDAYKNCIFHKHQAIKVKKDESLVTNLDVETEKYIIAHIEERFNDKFLTEETSSNTKLGDRTWIIDPIDGTSFFVRGSSFYSIQIAFYDKNQTQFSVIYLPTSNEMYVGIYGSGVYRNNKKLKRASNVEFGRCNTSFCGSPSRWSKFDVENYKKILDYAKDNYLAPKFVQINSSGYSYVLLANGTIDFLAETAKNPWDYLPGDLIAKELGAKCYQIGGTIYYSFCPELDKFLNLK